MARRHGVRVVALVLLMAGLPVARRDARGAEDKQAARQLEELNRRLRERTDELLAAKDKLDAQSKLNVELERRLAALAKRLAAEEQARAALAKQLKQLRADHRRTEQAMAALEKTLANVEKDLQARLQEMVRQSATPPRRPAPPEIPVRWQVKPHMGFDAQDLTPDVAARLGLKTKAGVLVTDVRPGSPAAVAGLERHDVLQRFDGKDIRDFKDLKAAFADKKPGDEASLVVERGGRPVELKVKIGARKVRVGN